MDAAHWQRIQAIFHRVAPLPLPARDAALADACAGDAALADEVRALLDADARGGHLIDRDLGDVAHALLGAGAAALPERFGPYRILRLLGEGGMGVVYLAEREDLGTLVAVKLLRDAALSPARRERFASEQRALAQLDHPGIARLFDAGTLADGTPWFVMEYVEGLPLAAHCAARGAPLAERLRLFRGVCEAVQHAHAHAIIHRDLKPSNILVSADGQPTLLDFGIAKQLAPEHGDAELTRTALRMLTPAYAAPEQFRGDRVGVHTDVYALGVILYELLSERLPYDLADRTPAEAERLIAEHEPPRPSAVARARAARLGPGSHVPTASRREWADLDVLCLTAMHKDVRRRYRSVDALLRDLDHFLRSEPLEARPDTLWYRTGKFVRRRRALVSATTAVLLLVVALVAFYTVRLARAREAALAQAARTERIQQFMLSLFAGGEPDVAPAESLRVVSLVDRGVEEARGLDAEPEVQAELYHTLGGLYHQLGVLPRADSLLGLALVRRRALLGGEHRDVTRTLVALARQRLDQARLDDAEHTAREALAAARRAAAAREDGAAPELVRATNALAAVRTARGDYPAAVAGYEAALRLLGDSAASPDGLASLYGLAESHTFAGRYAAADSAGERALTLARALYGDGHPRVATDLANLGAMQFERGRYAEAEQRYRQALAIATAWHGERHPTTAAYLTGLGRALVFQRRGDEGVPYLRRALAVQEGVYGPVHPLVAGTLNELGSAAYLQDRNDEAEAHYRRVLDIYRAVHGDRHYLVALALSNVATIHMERREYAVAERLYRDVVRRFAETLAPDHQQTAIARIKLGRVLLRSGRFAEAATESLAGYEILGRESAPTVSYLIAARNDLVAAYDSLGQPERAARFRAELAELRRQAEQQATARR